MMIFSKRNKSALYAALDVNPKVKNHPIELVNEFNYLGCVLKFNLKWSSHIKKIYTSARKLTDILKCMAGVSWGAHPSILLNSYRSLIRSRLEWGAQIFNSASKTKSQARHRSIPGSKNILGVNEDYTN